MSNNFGITNTGYTLQMMTKLQDKLINIIYIVTLIIKVLIFVEKTFALYLFILSLFMYWENLFLKF